jgi:threonyl-tRNA synthetase
MASQPPPTQRSARSSHDAELYRQRHSAAHLLAEAVLEVFPGTYLGVGPPTEDGFYYDFAIVGSLTEAVLPQLEARVRELISAGGGFVHRIVSPEDARALFADQPFKLELIEGILAGLLDEDGNTISEPPILSTYRHGTLEDVCQGPHVTDVSEINPDALKLNRIAGAYWRGSENRPMLQRIYGTLWRTEEELRTHLWRLEEAKKRDHRKLGEELELFTFSPEVGSGLPLWLPHGTIIRDELEQWVRETERAWGYQRVATPHLTRSTLYYISGHLPYFKEDLYSPIVIDAEEYYLKPMNCPHHHMIYRARPRSYRELPMRLAEYGTVYRYESSGQLHGLMRARGFTQNDAHIYCRLEDAKAEFVNVMRLHHYYYRALGLTDFAMILALRDPKNTAKYHDDEQMWQAAEAITRQAMDESGIPYTEDVGGAAHYGPKVDFVVRSVTRREFAASTNQVDLYMPKRFNLTYVSASGREEYVVVLHRAPLGSHERFVAFLIEHFAGAFPVWLAPVQVQLIPVADRHVEYAERVYQELFAGGYRVIVDDANDRMQAKIRRAQLTKIPYMLIIGDREVAANTVAVRLRTGQELGAQPVTEFVDLLGRVVRTKSLDLG